MPDKKKGAPLREYFKKKPEPLKRVIFECF